MGKGNSYSFPTCITGLIGEVAWWYTVNFVWIMFILQ